VFPILAFVALVIALGLGYAIGRARRERAPARAPVDVAPVAPAAVPPALPAALPPSPVLESASADYTIAERARIIRSLEGETSALRIAVTSRDAAVTQLNDFAAERRRLFSALADAHGNTARYRQIIIDLENDAPPPLLGGPGTPDDLKLIVGVGPVLERMLYQLGVTTYRQIARWTERDIDEFDARLHEFPGRIRRDGWVTQARALHRSKYGAEPLARDRG
jgi:predicted flap endonuclease-1-like 5' DNA nuclease